MEQVIVAQIWGTVGIFAALGWGGLVAAEVYNERNPLVWGVLRLWVGFNCCGFILCTLILIWSN